MNLPTSPVAVWCLGYLRRLEKDTPVAPVGVLFAQGIRYARDMQRVDMEALAFWQSAEKCFKMGCPATFKG